MWLGAQIWGAPGALVGQAIGGVIFGLLAVYLARRVIDLAEAAPTTATPGLFQRQARQVILFFNRR